MSSSERLPNARKHTLVHTDDQLFKHDESAYRVLIQSKPWENCPGWFTDCKISALALMKMLAHANSGGRKEVMGLLLGRINDQKTMIVVDSFALPVEGTETRVNAQADAYEYMAIYLESMKSVGRLENAIGWYHSHPGYGCWLSGIDVSTQMLNQQFQEPWLAIVIDPLGTLSMGLPDIGAFRTYPKGYKVDAAPDIERVPFEKLVDFGVHCKQYYSLNISYFKSSLDARILDLLRNQRWVNTLGSTVNIEEYSVEQIKDIAEKIDYASTQLSCRTVTSSSQNAENDRIGKIAADGTRTACEIMQMVMSLVIKKRIFGK